MSTQEKIRQIISRMNEHQLRLALVAMAEGDCNFVDAVTIAAREE